MHAQVLRLRRFIAPGGCYHIHRSRMSVVFPMRVHRHDFPELFWIEHGSGRHRVDGVEYPLSAGDLCLVRPEDEHGLAGGERGLTMLNIALAPAVAADLAARYGTDGDLWSGGPSARHRRLSPPALSRLGAHIPSLTAAYGGARERLHLDRFLLELVDVLAQGSMATPGPAWLSSAIATIAADPRLLADGTLALRTLSGRSREHVSRSMRRHLGAGPRRYLLGLRLERAAQALRMGDAPVLSLALDAGFANLSYFHRRFRAHFGCTPRTYRRLHQAPTMVGRAIS